MHFKYQDALDWWANCILMLCILCYKGPAGDLSLGFISVSSCLQLSSWPFPRTYFFLSFPFFLSFFLSFIFSFVWCQNLGIIIHLFFLFSFFLHSSGAETWHQLCFLPVYFFFFFLFHSLNLNSIISQVFIFGVYFLFSMEHVQRN